MINADTGDAAATTKPHYVYRHYSATHELLYVGRSDDPLVRYRNGHRRDKEWSREVAEIACDEYPSVDLAKLAEALAIEAEQPKYNRVQPDPLLMLAKQTKQARREATQIELAAQKEEEQTRKRHTYRDLHTHRKIWINNDQARHITEEMSPSLGAAIKRLFAAAIEAGSIDAIEALVADQDETK